MKRLLGRDGEVHYLLLAFTFLMIAVQPIEIAASELIGRIVLALVIVGSLAAVYSRRKLFHVGLVIGVPALLLIATGGSGSVDAAGLGLSIATLLFVSVVLLTGIVERPAVTGASVASALTVYLLLGILWSQAYALVDYYDPSAFYGLDPDAMSDRRELFYYSFVTLTTLGYGDIGPASPAARSLAITQAIAGQLYLVVLVAALVGAWTNRKSSAAD
jgi:voltage-gated potassium channel